MLKLDVVLLAKMNSRSSYTHFLRTKGLLYIVLGIFVFSSCKNNAAKNTLPENEDSQPQMEISPEIYDFGTLQSGDVVSFSFKIENVGTGGLVIDSVICDCQCVEINLPEKSIQPSEPGYLEVTYKSAGDWGNVIKEIQIYPKDCFSVQKVYISANVKNDMFD